MPCVLQPWVCEIPMMQQTVLLTAVRGPDGLPKYGPTKMLLRWMRRCFLYSALHNAILEDPWDSRGGSFTGPSLTKKKESECVFVNDVQNVRDYNADWRIGMNRHMDDYLKELDAIPHHFQMHFMHAAQILGDKHPNVVTRVWWDCHVYQRLVDDMHLQPESSARLNFRLGDNEEQWRSTADHATQS